jgi:hypothetical protein
MNPFVRSPAGNNVVEFLRHSEAIVVNVIAASDENDI